MTRRMFATVAVLLAASFTMTISGTASAQQGGAANTATGNGLRLSPVRQELTIEPGKSATIDVYVENVTDIKTELRAIVNDFMASSDESGTPRVLFEENADAPSHGLRRYVKPVNNLTLEPKEMKIVKVTVAIPENAAGGGYFGAVRFAPASADNSKNVSLTASVGSLLLVRVPGEVKEQMGIASMNVSKGEGKAANFFTNGDGLKTVVRFKNSGNVQLAPFGKVRLMKSGKEVASYEVNNTDPRGSVLPDSVRRFSVDFGDKAKSLGKYSVEGAFGYGEGGQLVNAKTTFYVVPLPFIIAAVVLLLAIIFGAIVFPRMLKSHDRKLIRKLRKK